MNTDSYSTLFSVPGRGRSVTNRRLECNSLQLQVIEFFVYECRPQELSIGHCISSCQRSTHAAREYTLPMSHES